MLYFLFALREGQSFKDLWLWLIDIGWGYKQTIKINNICKYQKVSWTQRYLYELYAVCQRRLWWRSALGHHLTPLLIFSIGF